MTSQSAKPNESPAVATLRASGGAATGRLAGKVALVTGAAGNIGEVIVRRYLEEGARVVMVGRNRPKLEAAREALLAATGAPAAHALGAAYEASLATQERNRRGSHYTPYALARHVVGRL